MSRRSSSRPRAVLLPLVASALLAATFGTSPAAASGAVRGAREQAPSRTAQAALPTMPVADPSRLRHAGRPTPGTGSGRVGLDAPAARPGSTRGRRGVRPVRVTCRADRRAGRVRCVGRSGARIVVRCSYRGTRLRGAHVRSCRRRAVARLSRLSRAAVVRWDGWPSTVSPAVGMLLFDGEPLCSATVVDPTLVLTAAHCIWADGAYLDLRRIRFVPGRTWGDFGVFGSVSETLGQWALSNMWVPGSYTAGDFSTDFALLEIPPLLDGRRLNAFTGAFAITPNVRWSEGMRSYLMGYPQSGFWSSALGGYGRGQYACDSLWSGEYQRDGAGWSVATDCTMNQGASGGPWFVLIGSSWTIAGVNSRCTAYPGSPPKRCDPYARQMLTSYLDDGFLTFWNSVQPQLQFR